MSVEAFIDTNILIYAAAGRVDTPDKYDVAWTLLDEGTFGWSGQVLAELYVNAIKRPKVPLETEGGRALGRQAVHGSGGRNRC